MAAALMGLLLYGGLFCLMLPLSAILWAVRVDDLTDLGLPAIPPIAGLLAAAAGLTALALGVIAIRRHGQGWPMNAFPPQRLVEVGIYRWLPHPIYLGATVSAFGLALAAGSGAGFWLVAPILAL